MLSTIIEAVIAIFKNPVLQNDLEAYVAEGNPQTPDDVDRLEREFHDQRRHLSQNWYS